MTVLDPYRPVDADLYSGESYREITVARRKLFIESGDSIKEIMVKEQSTLDVLVQDVFDGKSETIHFKNHTIKPWKNPEKDYEMAGKTLDGLRQIMKVVKIVIVAALIFTATFAAMAAFYSISALWFTAIATGSVATIALLPLLGLHVVKEEILFECSKQAVWEAFQWISSFRKTPDDAVEYGIKKQTDKFIKQQAESERLSREQIDKVSAENLPDHVYPQTDDVAKSLELMRLQKYIVNQKQFRNLQEIFSMLIADNREKAANLVVKMIRFATQGQDSEVDQLYKDICYYGIMNGSQ